MPARDPAKRRATARAWYARNRDRVAAQSRSTKRVRKQELVAWYVELKALLVCTRCGESHPACIQFHHADAKQKEASVADAVRRGWSRNHVLREIQGCVVLCANCHAKHHAKERAHGTEDLATAQHG